MKWFAVVVAVAPGLASSVAAKVPAIDDLIGIETIREARIAPDGSAVAYTVTRASFDDDAYVSHIWLARGGEEPFALTGGVHSATRPRWSPDGKWLAFLSSRFADKTQVFVIRPDAGEARRVTDSATDVSGFAWSADGKSIAYGAPKPPGEYLESRKAHMGGFHVVRREYQPVRLWTLDVEAALGEPSEGARRTGDDMSVGSFAWSPDGTHIVFDATIDPDLIHRGTADIYLLALEDGAVRKIVSEPGPDTSPRWSPDGSRIVFSTFLGREPFYSRNNELAIVPAAGGAPVVLTEPFDEEPRLVAWKDDGIYFSALQKTASHLFRIEPASSTISQISAPETLMAGSFSVSADGTKAAFVAPAPDMLPEVYLTTLDPFEPEKVTDSTAQIEGLDLASRELVTWTSRDGTTIEGVLIKSRDFDPGAKHPLLCVIHGGPTGIDRPYFRETRYYPVDIWAARGAVVLKVNYRGSAGYGEAFRRLNERNLGVGDAWDVLSGVDALVKRGFIDTERMGVMGWSQGGYISAFLTATTDRFAAISVGAGISNWATYYYNTDITPFTIQYLGADPVTDPEIYEKTSPMTYIENASTPTLIQHGENDRRVPIPNGYELRQALEDRNVPVEMVVYEGFGHGITKPRSQRAVMWHNLVWFNHYLWDDPLPSLAAPELPAGEPETELTSGSRTP